LGLAGDRSATPHLVGALEDSAVEVRRAAVESLASLRDPEAIAPLEALLRREKKSKTKVNRKLVEHAIQTCREGFAEEPALAAPVAEAAPETASAPAVEEEAVAEHGVAAAEEPGLFVEEPTAEVAPVEAEATAASVEAEVEPAAPAASAEPSSLFESRAPVEEFTAVEETPTVETPTLVAEAETVEVAPPTAFEEVSPAAVEPVFVEEAVEEERAEAEAAESASPAGLAEAEPVVEDVLEVAAPAAEERVAAEREERAEDWVELDMNELGAATPPASPGLYAQTFETSAGEPITDAPAAAEPPAPEQAAYEPFTFEPSAFEPAVVESAPAEAPAEEPQPAEAVAGFVAAPEAAPAPGVEEKGVALFNEYSSVPANIQQRLASHEPAERAAAITELARVDTGEAFQQVCAAFDDEAKEVRSAAARALYDMQGDRAESFTRALREAGPERRRNIGAAISSSGLASEAVSQLTGESREKTYEAFSLLFLMAKAGEVQPLVRAIEGHPNNEVRLAVVKLLALSGQKEILPAFRRLAVRGSLPTEVRSAVMEAIYQISSQSEPTPAA
ncbi:MAG: HEAT repeat domain-containing protein, partial [Acidobacteriota bacterium]|nr:HEAT repeat domain-containing protein [Acidobacteriota bacterium]